MGSKEIFKEFEFLLEKSQRSFNRLRDLPPYGNSHWEQHFHKAFHIYSKLWKFQQDHRELLTSRGMERWEVGDIASKIGQLYYNYYLRTSELRFLHEAYVFYEAIRSRAYFAQAATDPNLAIKQLRYFARFVIICLLLNRRDEVWQLLQEFQALISAYVMKYKPPDSAEWRGVINEITVFLNADVAMPVPRAPGQAVPFRVSLRAAPNQQEVKLAAHKALLADAVLVAYAPRQVKIAELPLDCFRMLQALEWDDAFSSAAPPATEHPQPVKGATSGKKAAAAADAAAAAAQAPADNPAKHLVYRPTSMQLLSVLSTTVEAMPRDAVLLLYVSAASSRNVELSRGVAGSASSGSLTGMTEISPAGSQRGGDRANNDGGGSSLPDNMSDVSAPSVSALAVLPPGGAAAGGGGADGLHLGPSKVLDAADSFLLPEDLIFLTRRSLFLVIDSDNAAAFSRLHGAELGRTAFCLMSPSQRPAELGDASKTGALLTLFLTNPLSAICLVAGTPDPSTQQLVDLQSTLGVVMGEWGASMLRAFGPAVGAAAGATTAAAAPRASPWAVAFRDALLRRLMLRYVLCRALLGLHTSVGRDAANLPRCFPEMPRELAPDAPDVVAGVGRLVACLGRGGAFGSRALSVSDASSPMSVATTVAP